MDVKHAETPWSRNRYSEIVDARGVQVVVTNSLAHTGNHSYVKAAENEEFIMRACNAHDKLVEALQYAKARLELADESRFDQTTLPMIRAALKAAGAK